MADKKTKKRNRTYKQLKEMLTTNNYDKQFYLDQIEQYMMYYDNLDLLNEQIKQLSSTFPLDIKLMNEVIKEKRQVTKEMRNILAFFKLRPSEDELLNGDDVDDSL